MPAPAAWILAFSLLASACVSIGGAAIAPVNGRPTESTNHAGAVRAAYQNAAAFLGPGRIALISFVRAGLYRGEERLIGTSVCIPEDEDGCRSARWFVNGSELRARTDRHLVDDLDDAMCLPPMVSVFDLDDWTNLRRVEVDLCGAWVAFDARQIEDIRGVVAAVAKVDRPESHVLDDLPAIKGWVYPVRPAPR